MCFQEPDLSESEFFVRDKLKAFIVNLTGAVDVLIGDFMSVLL